jgi:predicted O-methyltransferase YrrM
LTDRGHYHEYFPFIKKHLLSGALLIADNAGNMNQRMKPFFDLLTDEKWDWEIKDLDNGILIANQRSGGTS